MNKCEERLIRMRTQEYKLRDKGFCCFKMEKVSISASLYNYPLNLTEFPNCPRVVEALRETGCTLIGDVPCDLKRLLLMRGVGHSAIYKFLVNLREVAAKHELDPTIDLNRNAIIVLLDKTIVVPDSCLHIYLDNAAFSHSVEKILFCLAESGLNQIKDLPSQLDEYLLRLPGVGRTKVERFSDELAEFIRKHSERSNVYKTFMFRKGNIVIPDKLFNLKLDSDNFPNSEQWLKLWENTHVNTLQDVPDDCSNYQEELTIGFQSDIMQQLKEYNFITMKHEFVVLVDDIVAGKHVIEIKPEHWKIFRTRVLGDAVGKHITLENISNELHLTRERIRQICKKVSEKLTKPFGNFFEQIKEMLNLHDGLMSIDELLDDATQNITEKSVIKALMEQFDITYEVESGVVYQMSRDESVRLIADWGRFLVGRLPVAGITEDELTSAANAYSVNASFSSTALKQVALKHFLMEGYYGYRFKSLNKAEMLTYVLYKYFPQGIALYKDFEKFTECMNEEFDNEFKEDTKRSIIAALQREEGEVYLWGLGFYIHRAHIHVERANLIPIVDWVNEYFKSGVTQLSAYKPYEVFKMRLTELGIPNEYALYSCLRRYYAEEFYLPRTPWIFPVYIRGRQTLTEAVESYAITQQEDISYEKLKQEFVLSRGWKEYMLQQAISSSTRLLRVNFGRYIHVDKLKVDQSLLYSIASEIKGKLVDDKYVSVSKIFLERYEDCRRSRIVSPVLLFNILKYNFFEEMYFPKFPIVQKNGQESMENITCRHLVEEFLLKTGKEVPRTILKEKFEGDLGWDRRLLDDAIFSSPLVVPVLAGQVYVHRGVLGWNSTKQLELEELLMEVLDSKAGFGEYFVSLPVLVASPVSEALPILDNKIEWTADMLSFFASDITGLMALGTRRLVIMMGHNPIHVENEVELIAYILNEKFNGSAKLRDLENALHAIALFSSEFPETYRKDKENLPYEIQNNHIILKKEYQKSMEKYTK